MCEIVSAQIMKFFETLTYIMEFFECYNFDLIARSVDRADIVLLSYEQYTINESQYIVDCY